ncbi:right-handed parallel beta-helix repeat-containing protein [Polymorphobacter fuscus]|uniref:Right handed beta helix domain-containing protein n=1 Tax=Sandarakinorhabdus fusca TaxID=1439888 RepID=A0A7C9GYZ1_9SPHN|nr:right-handed parallel beta-helix repeat-containing protein [Polymorphobacter fuscus]KAB7644947.1 right-handed parallel beta-helix repeat-containing protein [Polymorphobacter fuscus]MQT18234.1 hypothetical protein [Polymorphobacter fuscus]NJC09558.1 hypothetical protein [Polymorphobacter fuscus]
MIIIALALAALPGLTSGGTVTLPPGPHPMVEIRGKTFDPPVTINATGAVVKGLRIWDSKGIIWRGGTIHAPSGNVGHGPVAYGADIRRADTLTIDGATFTNALRGAVVADSRNLVVRNAQFKGLQSDGLDVAGSSHVLIENNRFTDFDPVKATGNKADGTWKDGDHPDAIQMWTTPTNKRVTDVVIRGNTVDGDTQGINFFGPRGDGYARVKIEDNDVRVAYPAAISLGGCDDCSVRNNRIKAAPGAKFRANVRFDESKGKACGNDMPGMPNHPAARRC